MKVLLATAIAAILSLFGIHQAPAHTAHTPPSAQVASAVVAVEDPFHPAANGVATTARKAASGSASSMSEGPPSATQQTIFKQDITRPVYTEPIEHFVARTTQPLPIASGAVLGASTDATAAKLTDLQDQINALSRAPRQVFVPTFTGPAATIPHFGAAMHRKPHGAFFRSWWVIEYLG